MSRPSRIGEAFVALHERLSAAPWQVVVLVLVLSALIAGGLARFRFASQMTDLMPASAERDRLGEVLDRFQLAGTFLIHLEHGGEAPDPDALVAAADQVAAALAETEHFKDVVHQVAEDEQAQVFEAIFPRRYYLLPEEDARQRIDAAGVERGVERTFVRLLGPGAGAMEPMLRSDPLGFGEAVLARVLTGQQQYAVTLYHGRFVSDDRRHAMIIAEPRGQGMDTDALHAAFLATQAALDATLAEPAYATLTGDIIGGPVFAAASARVIQRDVRIAMIATGVGILLLFGLFFRKLRVLLLAYTPPLLGVAGGIGLLGYVHRGAHGLSLAIGAAVLGITVDYTIHFFTRALQLEAEHSREEALRHALREVTPALSMGCLTTMIGFATLLLARTVVLRDMSTMALGGIAAAFVLCAAVMPVVYRRFGGARRATGNRAAGLGRWMGAVGGWIDRRPLPFLLGWVALMGALVALSPGMQFDGDIRNMDYQPPEILEQAARFEEAFGAGTSGAMVVVEGETLEQALAANDRILPLLEGAVADGSLASISSTSPILPSGATQEARRQALVAADVEALVAQVEAAAAARGFAPGYFEPFAEELRAVADGSIPPLTYEELEQTASGTLLRRRVSITEGSSQVLTMVELAEPADGDAEVGGLFPPAVREAIEQTAPSALVVSFRDMAALLLHQVKTELVRLAGICLGALALVMLAYYRRPGPALLALLPCLAAFAAIAGSCALLDVSINIANVCGVAIALGISIDYGVFVVDRMVGRGARRTAAETLGTTGTAVLISAATTAVGLGTMIPARNPAMSSMGIVVVCGVAGGLVTALIGVPALLRLVLRRA